MSSKLTTIHFSDGHVRHEVSETRPKTGDAIHRNGTSSRIAQVSENADERVSIRLCDETTFAEAATRDDLYERAARARADAEEIAVASTETRLIHQDEGQHEAQAFGRLL